MGEDRSQQLDNEAILSSLEIDTIGEILNISMGSAATAISTLLDRAVKDGQGAFGRGNLSGFRNCKGI